MNGILRQFQNPLPSREGGEGALQEADKAQFSSQFAIAPARISNDQGLRFAT